MTGQATKLYCSDGLLACGGRRKALHAAQNTFDELQVENGLLIVSSGTGRTAQGFRSFVDESDACNKVSHREAEGHGGHAEGKRCT